MKIIATLAIIGLVFNLTPIFAKKLASLPEVARPVRIQVDKDQLYISDNTVKLHLYSMKNFKYVKQIGGKGAGPSEYSYPPIFQAYPTYLFLSMFNKMMVFSRDGEYKNEFRTRIYFNSFYPVGENFVGMKGGVNNRDKMSTKEISFYTRSDELKQKKSIYYTTLPKIKYTGGKEDVPLFIDRVDFVVYDDKVFLGDSYKGFLMIVFDSEGNELTRFKLDVEKQKISEDFKKEYFSHFGTNISVWEQYKKYCNPYFPEYFPSYMRFVVDNGKIYFFTWKKIGGKREVLITDLKGKLLKRSVVPWTNQRFGFDFCVYNDKFYYLVDNEDSEEWELHVEDIK